MTFECHFSLLANPYEFEFEPKIQLELKRDQSGGGCG